MKRLTVLLALVLVVAAVVIGVQVGRNNTLQQEKATLQTDLDTAKAELETAQQTLTQTTADRDQATADMAVLQSAHDVLVQEKDGLTDQITQANNVVTALTDERVTLAKQVEDANLQLAALSEEKVRLTTQVEEAQKEIKALNERQQGIEAMLEGVNGASGQDVAASITQLIADRDAAQADLARITEEKTAAETALQELTDAKATVDASLEQALADQKTAEDALAALTAEKATADEVLAALTAEKTTVDEALTAMEAEKTAAQEALIKAEADAAEASKALETLTNENTAVQEALTKAEADAAEAHKALDSMTAEKAAAQEQLAQLTKDKEAVDTELAAAQEQLLAATQVKGDVTVFHTNDVHARVVEGADQIGYAKLATIVSEARDAGGTLLLDAGDALHGMAFAGATQGQSVVDLMNLLGYDAMTPGNHDFNYGYERLKELEKGMNFPLVNANILLADGSHAFTPYVVKEVAGRRIAIVGAANPQIETAIHPARIEGLTFGGIEKIEEAVQDARAEADVVILLAHWGADKAYDPNSSVLAALPGVALVVDAHSHTAFADIEQTDGAALIASAGEYLKNLGRAYLAFDADGKVTVTEDPVTFEATVDVVADQAVADAIAEIDKSVSEALSEVIGKAAVLLDGERANVRTQETNLGDLAADALLEATGADVAFTNGGGIRRSIQAGDITRNDVVEVFPFGNSVVVIEVTGNQIREAMEHGLRLHPEQNGGFPQVAGMEIAFMSPDEPGRRLVDLNVDGKPLGDTKKYLMATNDFLAFGGDGYEMLKEAPVISYLGTMDEVLGEYIQSLGTVTGDVGERIVLVTPAEPTVEVAPESAVPSPEPNAAPEETPAATDKAA